MLVGLGVIPCSDMVESSSSPIDRLSRGADEGPWVGVLFASRGRSCQLSGVFWVRCAACR